VYEIRDDLRDAIPIGGNRWQAIRDLQHQT